jgi:hypothetical protein
VVDPLQPVYKLPSSNEISIDKGRNFIRDNILVDDINNKKHLFLKERGLEVLKDDIQGSHPMKLTKLVDARQRL